MPCMKLNTAAVTSSHPPQRAKPALARLVRGARRVSHSPAASRTRAAGSSQAIWPPTSAPNMRPQPVWPQPPPGPPPTLPVSLPVSRPKPL
jgi:hypothetical protein